MPTSILAFNASLRRAAARPTSALRGFVAALTFLVVATPVSAALCAASMTAGHLPAAHVVQHDHHADIAAHVDHGGSDAECCDTQISADWTAVPRSTGGDAIDIALHLLPYATVSAYAFDLRPQAFAPRVAFNEAGIPPPESILRRSPRLLL